MILPNYARNSQSGQILIIFLLILVVGLAITLSIASRTVTDVRQTTTSDESNRAYFAAEAGVENALKKIEESPGYITDATHIADVDLKAVNRSDAAVVVANLSTGGFDAFEFPNKVAKDEVAQVNLLDDFNTLGTAENVGLSVHYNDSLRIYWGDAITHPAIEVSIITCNTAVLPCGAASSFGIFKFAFDPVSRSNGFCTAVTDQGVAPPPISTTSGTNRLFRYYTTINLNTLACGNDQLLAANHPVLARIRLLYGGDVQVAVKSTTRDLPNQGSKITSIGKTPSGVTRKLTVTRLYPALPAIFDYVLYNGGSSALSKP